MSVGPGGLNWTRQDGLVRAHQSDVSWTHLGLV